MVWFAKQRGFTLIELMLVLAISSGLITVAIASQSGRRQSTAFTASIDQIKNQLKGVQNEATSGVIDPDSVGTPHGTGATGEVVYGKMVEFLPDHMHVSTLVGAEDSTTTANGASQPSSGPTTPSCPNGFTVAGNSCTKTIGATPGGWLPPPAGCWQGGPGYEWLYGCYANNPAVSSGCARLWQILMICPSVAFAPSCPPAVPPYTLDPVRATCTQTQSPVPTVGRAPAAPPQTFTPGAAIQLRPVDPHDISYKDGATFPGWPGANSVVVFTGRPTGGDVPAGGIFIFPNGPSGPTDWSLALETNNYYSSIYNTSPADLGFTENSGAGTATVHIDPKTNTISRTIQ